MIDSKPDYPLGVRLALVERTAVIIGGEVVVPCGDHRAAAGIGEIEGE